MLELITENYVLQTVTLEELRPAVIKIITPDEHCDCIQEAGLHYLEPWEQII